MCILMGAWAAVFVVLGIGADDIFIITDAFKQSFALLPTITTLDQRMSWVLRRAVPAMGITSVTTAAAFAANGITAVPAIRMFGFFSACSSILQEFFLHAGVYLLNLRCFG